MSIIAEDIQNHWHIFQPLFSIRNAEEYDKAIERLNALLDEVGTNEEHPLYELLDTLGTIIHVYEVEHYSVSECSGVEVIKLLMEEHQLELSDLPELGTAEHAFEILSGKRDLTVAHIRALAARFHVSPAIFL